jgi:hypothetical protein
LAQPFEACLERHITDRQPRATDYKSAQNIKNYVSTTSQVKSAVGKKAESWSPEACIFFAYGVCAQAKRKDDGKSKKEDVEQHWLAFGLNPEVL